MATAAVDNRQQLQTWQFPMPQQSRASFHYAQPPAPPPAEAPLPPRNEKELTREMLSDVLTFFSTLIPSRFNGAPVRLVVHGGACMLLHPGLYALAQQQPPPSPSNSPHKSLPRRTTTRDVDYINRSFAYEWHNMGVPDATERLKDCMKVTAQKFRLGLDWMNSDADVALPMANDPTTGQRYDPIYTAALKPNNVSLHTVFTSPNGMLTLVSVTPFWSVALKLVRYTKWDPGDICLLLRNGTNLSGTQWSTQMIEDWLFHECWPMGYSTYDPTRMREMKSRIVHAIQVLSNWGGTVVETNPNVTANAAMGGGGDTKPRPNATPPFIPPPPAQTQHDLTRWMSPSQHAPHAPGPNTRKPNPSLVHDEWPVSMPMPRPKSHSHSHPHPHSHTHTHTQSNTHSHSQSQIHPHPQAHAHAHRASMSHTTGWQNEHVRQFDNHIVSMLHASVKRDTPVIPAEPAVIPIIRRKRDKQRDADRKRDRTFKWFGRDASPAVLVDSDSEDSEDEWLRRPREKGGWVENGKEREKEGGRLDQEDRLRGIYHVPQQQQMQTQAQMHQSQQQHQNQHQQQEYHRRSARSFSRPQEQPEQQQQQQRVSQISQPSQDQARPPAWHIYAQPQATPPQSQPQPRPQASQPLATIDSNRRARSRSANPRRQHRPPSLELEPLHEIGSLGIF